MRTRLLVGCVALVGSIIAGTGVAAAEAGSGAGVSGPGDNNANDSRSRRVCRSIVPTGSRMSTRVCRTQAEWDEAREQTQRTNQDQDTTANAELNSRANLREANPR